MVMKKLWLKLIFLSIKTDNVNDASFIQKLMEVIDKVAQVKNKTIKKNSQEWFDSQISENLIIWDKLFKKNKKNYASCK